MNDLDARLRAAVKSFWAVRTRQRHRQAGSEVHDKGERGAVTGGAQMKDFADLLSALLIDAGLPEECVYLRRNTLPGFFRPTKDWDLLAVVNGHLLVSVEFKSQVGPSFGNNFNNRAEEAVGSATDLWTAFREGAFVRSPRPWVGYMILLEEAPGSTSPVKVSEPHFGVFPEFNGASYAQRYEQLCLRLVRERLYDATCLLLTSPADANTGAYRQPSVELGFRNLAIALSAHVETYVKVHGV